MIAKKWISLLQKLILLEWSLKSQLTLVSLPFQQATMTLLATQFQNVSKEDKLRMYPEVLTSKSIFLFLRC